MVDEQHRRPAVDDRAQPPARAPRSPRCRGPPRARRGSSSRGCAASAARHADQLALALRELAGQRVGRLVRAPAAPAPSSTARSSVAARGQTSRSASRQRRPARRRPSGSRGRSGRRTARPLCQVRASPTPRALVRRQAGEVAAVERRRCPCSGTKPVIASMKVVLPAPFGPISPTSWPSLDLRSTSAARARRRSGRTGPPARACAHRWAPPAAEAATAAAAAVASAAASRPRLLGGLRLLLRVLRSRDALGVEHEVEDQRDAADEQRPRAGDPEHSCRAVREHPSDAMRPANTAPDTIVMPPT